MPNRKLAITSIRGTKIENKPNARLVGEFGGNKMGAGRDIHSQHLMRIPHCGIPSRRTISLTISVASTWPNTTSHSREELHGHFNFLQKNQVSLELNDLLFDFILFLEAIQSSHIPRYDLHLLRLWVSFRVLYFP